jgi:hypothetical protein
MTMALAEATKTTSVLGGIALNGDRRRSMARVCLYNRRAR